MKIHPAPKKIVFRLEVPKVGNLVQDNKPSAREIGIVIAVGKEVVGYKKGDTILVKTWGVEEIEIDGEKYHFVSYDHAAICGAIT